MEYYNKNGILISSDRISAKEKTCFLNQITEINSPTISGCANIFFMIGIIFIIPAFPVGIIGFILSFYCHNYVSKSSVYLTLNNGSSFDVWVGRPADMIEVKKAIEKAIDENTSKKRVIIRGSQQEVR